MRLLLVWCSGWNLPFSVTLGVSSTSVFGLPVLDYYFFSPQAKMEKESFIIVITRKLLLKALNYWKIFLSNWIWGLWFSGGDRLMWAQISGSNLNDSMSFYCWRFPAVPNGWKSSLSSSCWLWWVFKILVGRLSFLNAFTEWTNALCAAWLYVQAQRCIWVCYCSRVLKPFWSCLIVHVCISGGTQG